MLMSDVNLTLVSAIAQLRGGESRIIRCSRGVAVFRAIHPGGVSDLSWSTWIFSIDISCFVARCCIVCCDVDVPKSVIESTSDCCWECQRHRYKGQDWYQNPHIESPWDSFLFTSRSYSFRFHTLSAIENWPRRMWRTIDMFMGPVVRMGGLYNEPLPLYIWMKS